MALKWNDMSESSGIDFLAIDVDRKGDSNISFCGTHNPLCQKPHDVQKVKDAAFDKIVYLDNNATHPILPEVKKKVIEVMDINGNASSKHIAGQKSRVIVEECRDIISKMFFGSVIFTSGGTESDNMAIRSFFSPWLPSIVTTNIEHKAVLNSVINSKLEHKIIKVGADGLISRDCLKAALTPHVNMVSIMTANNEIGVVQDISGLAAVIKEYDKQILVHTDFCQVLGKYRNKFDFSNIDMVSLSGHKIGALTGIGCLCVKNLDSLSPFLFGGNQEWLKRPGTYNMVGIASFGEALKHYDVSMVSVRDYLEEKLKSNFDCFINCEKSPRLDNTTSITFKDFIGEDLMLKLSDVGIFLSTQSACNSYSKDPSHVLKAIGLTDGQAYKTIRISTNRWTSTEDVDYLISAIKGCI